MGLALRNLAPLYLASGAAALIAEITWMRWLRPVLGATAPAASATLVAFFVGSALGALLGVRLVRRTQGPGQALRLYGALELGALVGAALVPVLLAAGEGLVTAVYELVAPLPWALLALRFGVGIAATLPATLCIGATLPAIGAAGVGAVRALGSRGSALYAINTAGAAVGVALASFWLPPWIGVWGTYTVGLGLFALAGLGALAMASGVPDSPPPPQPKARDRGRATRGARGWLGLALLSGFGSFAGQVLFVQSFAQVLNQSVHAFGAVLIAVLASLAIGAAVVAWLDRRAFAPARVLLGLALSLTALALAAFPAALFGVTDGLHFVSAEDGGLGYVAQALLTVAGSAGPSLLAGSLVLPLVFAWAGAEAGVGSGADAGAWLGRLAAANTLGAVLGALVGPYVLVPALGLWGAFLALAIAYAVPAIFLRDLSPASRWLRDGALGVGWVAVIALASPLDIPIARLAEGERLLYQSSDAAGIVAVVERAGERLIRNDNHYALGGTAERIHEERQGHLPLLLHGNPKRVAFVGTATGITAGAALSHPVASIHLVEIVPAVAEAARTFFVDANRGVYDDPRSRIVIDDARNFLHHTTAQFDVVVADLFVPWRAGTGSLYTVEHFGAVRARLAPRGLFCQWLPLYQLSEAELRIAVASFVDVFPEAALFRGDFYGSFPVVGLVGWRDGTAAESEVSAAARRLREAGVEDRWVTDPGGVWSLFAGAIDPELLAEVPRNRDSWPRIEFLAAARHAGNSLDGSTTATGLVWLEAAERLRARGTGPFSDLGAEARRSASGGAALALAGSLYTAGRVEEASRALGRAAELLPPSLLADAEPDPTAAELWFDR